MEAVIFCGIQGSGKTTFYKQWFLKTHLRLSLDLLHTRNKEALLLMACLKTQQRFVIDNTNPTIADRLRYIQTARAAKFKLVCYFFETDVSAAILRNNQRIGKERIPIPGIRGTFRKLQVPSYDEGFDQIYIVKVQDGSFDVAFQSILNSRQLKSEPLVKD